MGLMKLFNIFGSEPDDKYVKVPNTEKEVVKERQNLSSLNTFPTKNEAGVNPKIKIRPKVRQNLCSLNYYPTCNEVCFDECDLPKKKD